jgi:hypothetical protein
MASGRRLLLAAALVGAACASERELPPPAPEAVDPAVGFLSVDVPVVIRGRDFHVRASQSVEGAGDDRVSARFRAWLGGVELREVTWIDQGTLAAIVPANGLSQGDHDLAVEGPYGTRGTLPAAYGALPGTPPDLAVDPVAVPSVVILGEPVTIRVHVTNAGPGPVDSLELQLKHAEVGGPASGEPIAGPPLPATLVEGESIDVEYVFTASALGTFECEAKVGGYSPGSGGPLPTVKVRVRYEVVPVDAVPALSVDPVAIPSLVAVGGAVTIRVHLTNGGPGAIDGLELQVKAATVDGPASGRPLPGSVVGGGPIPTDLADGASLAVDYVVAAEAAGTFECEAKVNGRSQASGVALPTRRVRVRYEVVDALP